MCITPPGPSVYAGSEPMKVPQRALSRHLTSFTDALHSKTIDVSWNSKGLVARVCEIQSGAISEELPLTGVPAQLMQNVHKTRAYLQQCYLVPERGIHGDYNRVAVHVTAKGGGAKIPFQPGLALGSLIKGDLLIKMEKYADIMAKKQNLEEQIRGAEQRRQELETRIDSRYAEKPHLKPKPKEAVPLAKAPAAALKEEPPIPDAKVKDVLIQLWDEELQSIDIYIKELGEAIKGLHREQIPVFSNFQQGVVSPIDIGASKIENQPRAFRTSNFSSQYITMSQEVGEIHNNIMHSSSSNDISLNVGWNALKAGIGHTRSDAIAKRVVEIKKENKAEGVLVINSMVTSQYVRCITKIKYDLHRLRQILNIMKGNDKKLFDRYGITEREDGTKEIYLLTESPLGGSFTAIVTFKKEDKMQRDQEDEQKQGMHQTSAKLGGSFWFFKAHLDLTNSSGYASQTENDVLKTLSQMRVNIEFYSQGVLPAFGKNVIKTEVFKHLNLDPAKFELSKQDEEEAEKISTLGGDAKQVALEKRRMKMETVQLAYLNTYRGLASQTETTPLHTAESVMGAFENFNEQMTKDAECGVPVGFNYTVLTQSEIESRIAEMEKEGVRS